MGCNVDLHLGSAEINPIKKFIKYYLTVDPGYPQPANEVDAAFAEFMSFYGSCPPPVVFFNELGPIVVQKKRIALPDASGNFALDSHNNRLRTMCYVGIRLNTFAERDAIQDQEDEQAP